MPKKGKDRSPYLLQIRSAEMVVEKRARESRILVGEGIVIMFFFSV